MRRNVRKRGKASGLKKVRLDFVDVHVVAPG
jgi:hypothetical protein